MNQEEIDDLFEAFDIQDYRKILKYADIELDENEALWDIFHERNEEIFINIMNKIKTGDYEYFLSLKNSDDFFVRLGFTQLMCHSGKSDDIIKVIESSAQNLGPSRTVDLIKATHRPDYIKSIIENEDKRFELKIDPFEIEELIEATNDVEYIKSIIDDKEKRDRLGIRIFDRDLIKATNDAEYIKSIIDDEKKRDRLGIQMNTADFISLIIATKDTEYIKSIVENKQKRHKFGRRINLIRYCNLNKSNK